MERRRKKNRKLGIAALAGRTGNERGMALILSLAMLVILTILGTWALDTSTIELRIAGNFKTNQAAYYLAEAGVGAAANPDSLTSIYLTYAATGVTTTNNVITVGTGSVVTVTTFLTKGALPLGSPYDGTLDDNGKPRFSGVYFAANAVGNAQNHAQVAVESVVAQVVGN